MQAYLDWTTAAPMAWDTSLYQSRETALSFKVDDANILVSKMSHEAVPGPLRYHSYIALATSTLVLFEPNRYPIQLHLKYLHYAVVEMRKLIARNSFATEDLLHGISRTLLASVLQHDVPSARAHLGAAAGIVRQQGGIQTIDTQLAAILRYADFHLSMVTLRAPAFPPVFVIADDTNDKFDSLALVNDHILMHSATKVRVDANSSQLPALVVLAIHRVLDGAIALARSFAKSVSKRVDDEELNWVASRMAETIYLMLGPRTSVLQRDNTASATIVLPSSEGELDDWTIVLILWLQLLICSANEPLGDVSIRRNILPLLPHDDPVANATRASLSSPVRDGLQAWNERSTNARAARMKEAIGDWLRLVDIVADMERDLAVHVAPFMRRLLAIRHFRAISSKVLPA